MGMTIGRTIACSTSMPDVTIAFSQAVIDKAHLIWLDVSKLLTAFPEHVKMLDDAVTFQGPVAIISSLNPTHRFYAQCLLGLAAGLLTCLFLKATSPKKAISPKQVKHMSSSSVFSTKQRRNIRCAVLACIVLYVAGRYLPTEAGRIATFVSVAIGCYIASRFTQASIATFASAAIGFYVAGRYLPTQAGVYFFRQPPFHV